MELSFSLRVLTFSFSSFSNEQRQNCQISHLSSFKKIFIIKSKYPNSSMSISKHFQQQANSKSWTPVVILIAIHRTNIFDCFVFYLRIFSSLLRSLFRVAIMGTRRRGDMVAAVRVAIGKNRKLPSVSRGCNRRRNECHPGIMSSITIFM